MKLRVNKSGFTLVEILIVMMIVGLLSTMAVSGYSQYRTSTLFGLAVDDLASKVYEMRSKTIYGTGNGNNYEHIKATLGGASDVPVLVEDKAKCYGVVWSKDSNGSFSSRFFSQNFQSKKVWLNDKWNYLGCGGRPQDTDFRPNDEADSQFFIKDIKLNGAVQNSLMLRFLPPNGAFELMVDNGEIVKAVDFSKLEMDAVYGSGDSPNRKNVDFNLVRSSYNSNNVEITN